jgi:hypothetical protein
MKFWQNNRLDGTFDVSIENVAAQFQLSNWWTAELDLEYAVRSFLIDAAGPISAVWDDERDLARVCAVARAAGWSRGSTLQTAAVA